ncbi:MAG: hypothetical protein QME07_06685 [bacterium]|nr:hypothetical protein [bacterium]
MTEEELREERRRIREENAEILKRELVGKEVKITTNIVGLKEKIYYVEGVREARIKAPKGTLFGVRLVNHRLKEEDQPFLRYPNTTIEIKKEDDKKQMTLLYASEVDIERDFRRLHRKTGSDMKISIVY